MIDENFIKIYEKSFKENWALPALTDYNSRETFTYGDMARQIARIHLLLRHCQIRRGDKIALIGRNTPRWVMAFFASVTYGAIIVPILQDFNPNDVHHIINHSDAVLLFSGSLAWEHIEMEKLSQVRGVISLDDYSCLDQRDGEDIMQYLADIDQHFEETYPNGFTANDIKYAELDNDKVCLINYTSGTTGFSKGVMLTHRMYRDALIANDRVLPLGDKDVALNFLPFTHVFERAWSYLCLAEGTRLAVNLRPADVLQSLQEVHPTCMCAVPRFWEKVYAGVQEKIRRSNPVQRKLLQEALLIGKIYNIRYKMRGLIPPVSLRLRYAFFEKTIIALLKKTLGLERANFFPTAGAAIPPAVEEFVHSAGLNMLAGYGLTESTATVSCDHCGKYKTIGSVGRLIEGLELKFGEDNEILLRGTTITKGYYRKEGATRAAIDEDGWFHTGDAGYMKNGELYLTDRIKDLFKTSNGKYIAPQMIESKLVVDRYIDQIVVIADQRKFVSALIVPEYTLLKEFAERHHIPFTDTADLCRNADINKMLLFRISTLQQEFAHYEQVKRITILPEPFSMEKGELTNTLKVKRPVVNKNYAAEIDAMYADEALPDVDKLCPLPPLPEQKEDGAAIVR